MDRLSSNRLFRCLVCLILVCCILICNSSIRAQATGLEALGIVGVSTVSSAALPIIVCTLAAMGIYAGIDSGAFETLANNAVDFLTTAGGYISDGCIELIRTVDEAGAAAYYVAGDLMETLRSWAFSSGTTVYTEFIPDNFMRTDNFSVAYDFACSAPFACLMTWDEGASVAWSLYISDSGFSFTTIDNFPAVTSSSAILRCYYSSDSFSVMSSNYVKYGSDVSVRMFTGTLSSVTTALDLTLGTFPSVSIDGTSALSWAPEYAQRQLRVINTGGSGDSGDDGNNDWKWYLPLSLGLAGATLYATTQADQWTGETPAEFDDYTTITEFEILDAPELDGYQGLEVSPLSDTDADAGSDSDSDTDPTTDPDAEAGSNPDSGTDAGTDAGTDTGTDTGTDAGSSSDPDASSNPVSQFVVDLTEFFPFCIPFDIYEFFTYLVAEPVAPVFHWEFQDLAGNVYEVDVDLSPWDSFAALFRDMQLILYIFGLMMLTRKFIKW